MDLYKDPCLWSFFGPTANHFAAAVLGNPRNWPMWGHPRFRVSKLCWDIRLSAWRTHWGRRFSRFRAAINYEISRAQFFGTHPFVCCWLNVLSSCNCCVMGLKRVPEVPRAWVRMLLRSDMVGKEKIAEVILCIFTTLTRINEGMDRNKMNLSQTKLIRQVVADCLPCSDLPSGMMTETWRRYDTRRKSASLIWSTKYFCLLVTRPE